MDDGLNHAVRGVPKPLNLLRKEEIWKPPVVTVWMGVDSGRMLVRRLRLLKTDMVDWDESSQEEPGGINGQVMLREHGAPLSEGCTMIGGKGRDRCGWRSSRLLGKIMTWSGTGSSGGRCVGEGRRRGHCWSG